MLRVTRGVAKRKGAAFGESRGPEAPLQTSCAATGNFIAAGIRTTQGETVALGDSLVALCDFLSVTGHARAL